MLKTAQHAANSLDVPHGAQLEDAQQAGQHADAQGALQERLKVRGTSLFQPYLDTTAREEEK